MEAAALKSLADNIEVATAGLPCLLCIAYNADMSRSATGVWSRAVRQVLFSYAAQDTAESIFIRTDNDAAVLAAPRNRRIMEEGAGHDVRYPDRNYVAEPPRDHEHHKIAGAVIRIRDRHERT